VKRGAAVAAGLAWLALASTACAGVFGLVSPNGGVKGPPPFALTGASPFSNTEVRFPGHVNATQRVAVGLGPDGAPVRVVATQRLVLTGTGDYEFLVPAPATAAGPAPDSQSQPGLRNVGLVWQGFSDRRRILSAVVTLRPRPAATGLPLQVHAGAGQVRLVDVAGRTIAASLGHVRFEQLARQLDVLAAALRRSSVVVTPLTVAGTFSRSRNLPVVAPLRVTGTIGGTPVDVQLGAGKPLEHTIAATGSVRLRVAPLPTQAIVPSAAQLRHARDPLVALQTALGSAAAASAYQRYLGLPDPVGTSTTTYVYRSAAAAAAGAARAGLSGGGPLGLILGLALGAAALWGLAVLWARS
jgi:hypothetical protein